MPRCAKRPDLGPKLVTYQQKIKLWFRALVPIPILLGVVLLLPNLDAPDLARFPPEDLRVTAETRSLTEVIAAPEGDWVPATDRSLFDVRVGTYEYWRRIHVPAAAGIKPEHFVVSVPWPFIPEVDFFLVEGGALLKTLAAGMDRPGTYGGKKNSDLKFPVDQQVSSIRTVYIRIKTSILFMDPTVMRSEAREAYVTWLHNLARGLICGFLIGLIMFTVATSYYLKQRMHRDYALFLVSVLGISVILSETFLEYAGLFQIRFETWFRLFFVTAFISTACYINFTRAYLSLQRNYPQLDRLMVFFIIASLVATPIVFLIAPTIAYIMFSLMISAISAIAVIGCLLVLNAAEVRGLLVALSDVPIGAVVQLPIASVTVHNILGADGLFFVASTWGAINLATAMARQTEEMQNTAMILRNVIDHEAPPTAINSYLDDKYIGQFSSATMEVTIMFIDIASFSRIAEKSDAHTVFGELSNRLEKITSIVMEYGGKIDRSLGDGVLCFFGHNLSLFNSRIHILQAYQAASKIQEQYRIEMYESALNQTSRIPLPVRIGIHTDKVTIGNMGSSLQIDFTMVGNGVNFANRLETACGPYRIMVSESTYEGLLRHGIEAKDFEPVMIAVKHRVELVKAFEINPHKGHLDQLGAISKSYLELMGEAVRDRRQPMAIGSALSVSTAYGLMRVKDFSRRGFLLTAQIYLAPKAPLVLKLQTSDSQANNLLTKHCLNSIEVEVRWSCRRGDEFDHGVQVVGGHPEQWDFLYELISSLNGKKEEQAA